MFFKFLALLFLVIFLIKIINPKTIPQLKTVWKFIKQLFIILFRYVVKGFIHGIILLWNHTVYVVGLSLVATIILFAAVFFISYYPNYTFEGLWSTFKHHAFDLYVVSFFVMTYLLGLLEAFKQKHGMSLHDSMKRRFQTFTFDFGQSRSSYNEHNNSNSTNGQYVYDEETQEYRYEGDIK